MGKSVAWLLSALTLLSGCSVPVLTGLGESEANEAVALLAENDIHGDKRPTTGDRYEVLVAREDLGGAIEVVGELSRHEGPLGVDSLAESRGMLPRSGEDELLVAHALSGEVATTLRTLPGVLDARVHIAPRQPADPLTDTPTELHASVLLRLRSGSPDVAVRSVQVLVAGAVADLDPNAVHVVQVPMTAATRRGGSQWAQVGPLVVAPGSAMLTRGLLLGSFALNLVLVGALLWAMRKRMPARA